MSVDLTNKEAYKLSILGSLIMAAAALSASDVGAVLIAWFGMLGFASLAFAINHDGYHRAFWKFLGSGFE